MEKRLLEILKLNSFKKCNTLLASGKMSDFFIDCKSTILTSEGHHLVGNILYNRIEKLKANIVAGVELGGCPIASAVSLFSYNRNPIDAIYIRKAAKDHGTKRMIEGNYKPNSNIVLLEDVVTTGQSSIKAVNTMRQEGLNVIGVICLVDRLEGGRENIEANGLYFESIYNRNDFMKK